MPAGLAGCQTEQRVVRDGWAGLRQIADKPQPQAGPSSLTDPAAGQGWAVLLQQFTGPDRRQQAQELMDRIHQAGVAADLWSEDYQGVLKVYAGRFHGPQEPAAQQTLERVQRITLDESNPFASARLVPLMGQGRFITDPLDLKQYVGYYTLQIGYYDAQFGKDFRQAAEDAARELREEGYEAYYYHGPFRSLVTVGLFTENDFVMKGNTQAYGPRIKTLQDKFPYNLGNGRTLIETVNGKNLGEQPSCLVRVF